VTAENALKAIQYEFENLSVDGHNGIFVVEKDKTINLVRLSNLGREKETTSETSTMLATNQT